LADRLQEGLGACAAEAGQQGGAHVGPRKAQQVPYGWTPSGTLLQRSAGAQARRHADLLLWPRFLRKAPV